MRTSPSSVAVFAAALLLAGCGGGAGSGSGAVPGGASGTQQQQLSPQDVAESGTQATFGSVEGSEAAANVANGSLGASSSVRSTQTLQGFTCRHRRSRTVTTNPDGSVTVETIDYYDAACTNVERDAVATYASNGGTATVARTVTTFSLTHAQLGQRKQTYALTGSAGDGTFTVQSAFYPGTSATPISQFAHNATVTASSYTGTAARTVNDAKPSINAEYGHAFATTATIGTDASGDTTYTGTRNGTLAKGALNGLTISSTPPFTIAGGTQLGTSALTGTVAYTSDGTLAAVNFTGTLISGNSIVVTSTTDASGALTVNGTITSATNAPVATFTTDANGNGVLTLADGTQVPIVDWHVIWS